MVRGGSGSRLLPDDSELGTTREKAHRQSPAARHVPRALELEHRRDHKKARQTRRKRDPEEWRGYLTV